MDCENREEFMDVTAKSRKRRRDDQDPPPPPPKDSDQSKKKARFSCTLLLSSNPQAQTSLAWKYKGRRYCPSYQDQTRLVEPVPEEERPETPKPDWIRKRTSYFRKLEIWAHSSNGYSRQTLPLGGPPGQVTIQPQYFFNKDLESLVSGNKERRNALSISKLKAAYYQDFRLEELVPSLWIESSVISEADFKNLHPNDFKDLYRLHLQGKLNHLSGSDKVRLFNVVNLWIRNIVIRNRMKDLQLGIKSYQTKLNLTEPSWDAIDYLFKEYYTIVSKPRALDHMVKDFVLFKFNRGMEYRIWSEDDKRRSKEFIDVIERRLKIRRIFRILESFVSRRLRDVNYRLIQRTK
ncbi:hypothetical protein Tco_0763742 [Tanacetum coccineum]